MKVLILSPRFPEAGGKGDQLRAFQQARHLAHDHDVTVLSAGPPSSAEAARELAGLAHVVAVPSSRRRRGAGMAGSLPRRVPGQVAWMMPRRAWQRAHRLAAEADVVLASTVRSLRGPLPSPIVLDHIDCLSLNMGVRAAGPEPAPVRLAARMEVPLMRAWEARAATWSAAQVVTARADAEHLPAVPPVEVIPQGWDGEPFEEPAGHHRDLDLVFTGNMAYPPNRDAALWLDEEILPQLLRRRPQIRALVVGRAADRIGLRRVEVASDVPDLHAYLRRAKVAVVPLRGGTGAPNKVLEAAASGAALVATGWTVERFGMRAPVAATAEDFAAQVDRLLADDSARSAAVADALPAVRRHTVAALVGRLERLLTAVADGGVPPVRPR